MKRKLSLFFLVFFLAGIGVSLSADLVEKKDTNGDKKIDAWTTRDAKGNIVSVAKDKYRHDGKPDYWAYYRNGKVYKREWDRNFDGKPDMRTLEDSNRLIETEFDDNFDGKFEKTVKAPEKGSSGHTKTTAGP